MSTLAWNGVAGLPSRGDNPFASCWTRPGSLPFLADAGVCPTQVLDAWRAHGCRGQIVGPHGVGKSTLVAAVGERLVERGDQPRWITLRAGESSPRALLRVSISERSPLLLDGLEQLTAWGARRVLRRCTRRGAGLLATTHRAVHGLPVLASLAPTLSLTLRLFDELTRDRPTPITTAMAAHAFAESGGDVRATWFRLYDLHESLVRG